MLHNQDWSATDFETLAPDAIPVTAYKPAGDRYDYDCAYTDWGDEDNPKPARDYYRVAWRAMAANTGERTLISAIIPPGRSTYPRCLLVQGSTDLSDLAVVRCRCLCFTLILDFAVRVAPKSGHLARRCLRGCHHVGEHALLH